MQALRTLLFIAVIIAMSVAMVWIPLAVVERKQKKICPACASGTVLFTDRKQDLCHKHWQRWDRINELEQTLDFDMRLEVGRTEQDIREEALDMLLGKLDQNLDLQYPVKMKIAGEWVQIGYLPEKPSNGK